MTETEIKIIEILLSIESLLKKALTSNEGDGIKAKSEQLKEQELKIRETELLLREQELSIRKRAVDDQLKLIQGEENV